MTEARKVVIDCGGSSTRLGIVEPGGVRLVKQVRTTSYDEFVSAIRSVDPCPIVLSVSLAGFVDRSSGFVRLSRAAPWARGTFAQRLSADLHCPVSVMNDGDAHAMSMLAIGGIELGAVAVSLGTSVGIGVVGRDRKLISPASGENWDLGEWRLDTRATNRDLWWALGSAGLFELEKNLGVKAGRVQFGYRLGAFLSRLTCFFQMKTVVLSGGIAQSHWGVIKVPLREELRNVPDHYAPPRVMLSPYVEAGLAGAAHRITLGF
ncbi:ROK family protein [Rhodococcus sp. WS3]|uniref:ROK family protein n=1 Tax=Rhodococcus sp. WS3 TaxID=2486271 RepID=UPI0016511A9B|nr:ROK family protein [Rhodococcus sp. WS3]